MPAGADAGAEDRAGRAGSRDPFDAFTRSAPFDPLDPELPLSPRFEHLSSLWRAIRSAGVKPGDGRYAVSETIEAIGGAPPKSFEAFVREPQAELAPRAA